MIVTHGTVTKPVDQNIKRGRVHSRRRDPKSWLQFPESGWTQHVREAIQTSHSLMCCSVDLVCINGCLETSPGILGTASQESGGVPALPNNINNLLVGLPVMGRDLQILPPVVWAECNGLLGNIIRSASCCFCPGIARQLFEAPVI